MCGERGARRAPTVMDGGPPALPPALPRFDIIHPLKLFQSIVRVFEEVSAPPTIVPVAAECSRSASAVKSRRLSGVPGGVLEECPKSCVRCLSLHREVASSDSVFIQYKRLPAAPIAWTELLVFIPIIARVALEQCVVAVFSRRVVGGSKSDADG
ncbi:hypothetical protein EVAR_76627_1 [Eumeta japonica]|uniref:Uncharacterized protein n=1 Tax=Eumeta variegata TaxID=151549 RepID=A0A4C1T557_EUMVA|nr:hypothetical protein EVAR_76627_1 [Eumeta japonica]